MKLPDSFTFETDTNYIFRAVKRNNGDFYDLYSRQINMPLFISTSLLKANVKNGLYKIKEDTLNYDFKEDINISYFVILDNYRYEINNLIDTLEKLKKNALSTPLPTSLKISLEKRNYLIHNGEVFSNPIINYEKTVEFQSFLDELKEKQKSYQMNMENDYEFTK